MDKIQGYCVILKTGEEHFSSLIRAEVVESTHTHTHGRPHMRTHTHSDTRRVL